MIFSVYDYQKNLYDHYEVGSASPPTAWFRRPIDEIQGSPDGVFSRPEVLAVRLPPGAKLVRSSPDAIGAVATLEQSVGSTTPSGAPAPEGSGFLVPLIAFVAGILIGGL